MLLTIIKTRIHQFLEFLVELIIYFKQKILKIISLIH